MPARRGRRVNVDDDGVRPQFLKIMLQSTLRSKKLLIPDEFVNQLGDEFSQIATLTVPNGRNWKVKIKKLSDNVWFDGNGWTEFLDYYTVSFGHGLVFRYEGDSSFHVTIFSNVSGCEIEYPHEVPNVDKPKKKSGETESESDTSVEIIDVKPVILQHKKSDQSCSSQRNNRKPDQFKRRKNGFDTLSSLNETSYRNVSTHSKRENSEELFVSRSLSHLKKKRRTLTPGDINKTNEAALLHKLESPGFMISLKRGHLLYVGLPSGFSRKYVPSGTKSVTLETPEGGQWDVGYYDNRPSSRSHCGKRMVRGWPGFVRDNNLEFGDACIFELIDQTKVVFRVWIYRVADYAGS